MPTTIDSIEIPPRFVRLATDWHGGQETMLYAVSSTGGLTRGTIRPRGCKTDEEWYARLWGGLYSELADLLRSLAERIVSGLAPEEAEDLAELREFAEFADTTHTRLLEEYELE